MPRQERHVVSGDPPQDQCIAWRPIRRLQLTPLDDIQLGNVVETASANNPQHVQVPSLVEQPSASIAKAEAPPLAPGQDSPKREDYVYPTIVDAIKCRMLTPG